MHHNHIFTICDSLRAFSDGNGPGSTKPSGLRCCLGEHEHASPESGARRLSRALNAGAPSRDRVQGRSLRRYLREKERRARGISRILFPDSMRNPCSPFLFPRSRSLFDTRRCRRIRRTVTSKKNAGNPMIGSPAGGHPGRSAENMVLHGSPEAYSHRANESRQSYASGRVTSLNPKAG